MADIPLVQLPYPEEETRTFELSTSLSPNWDKNGRIFYTDETGQVVRPQTKYNPLQMLGRRLKAFGSNAKNFVEDFNMDKSHTYFAPFEDINEQYKAGNINKSELPYLAQGRAEQEIRDAQQQERDNINRGWLGTGLSAASMLPIFNIPYVGTGLGGAMYDLGQGITEGNNAGELWDRTKRGFAIGESVGAIPYVGKLAGKTKAGQAVGSAFNKAGEKFANTKLYDALMTDIKGFNPNKQTVYHGSPYDFEKFSNEAIGTGEGAQAHGYGHYTALDKDIADKNYRDRLIDGQNILDEEKSRINNIPFKNTPLNKLDEISKKDLAFNKSRGFSYDEMLKNLENKIEHFQKQYEKFSKMDDYAGRAKLYKKTLDSDIEKYNILKENPFDFENTDLIMQPKQGQLYKLSVPKDDVMLREDLPFSEQPKAVQKSLENYFKDLVELNEGGFQAGKTVVTPGSEEQLLRDYIYNNGNGSSLGIYGGLADKKKMFHDLHKDPISSSYAQQQISKDLSDYGIKGISYNGGIDGEARVIFNPDDIVIGRKYYNQPNLYQQLTGKQNTGALVDALLNR